MNSPLLQQPLGFIAGGIHCGIKKRKKDLALIYSKVPATAAGVTTTNKVVSASVNLTRRVLANGVLQAIVINSGNANAVTGPEGDRDALEMARKTAETLKIDISKVAVASTGIIGKPLPIKLVINGIEKLSKKINPFSFNIAAESITTTDTFPKAISRTLTINGAKITITAIAKGAGMIYPNLATMLCFITTDVNITQPLFQQLLKVSVDNSFNCISVDGCTSTNDMVLAMANGMAENPEINSDSPALYKLQEEFNHITKTLAQMIVKDGEGATKLIQIQVTGAHNNEHARAIAFSVANSNLLKSSFYGETLNWGRIMAAIGQTDIKIDPERINIFMGGVLLIHNSQPVEFSTTDTDRLLRQKEINLHIELNQGEGQSTVWTSDLSPKYIRINMT